MSVVIIGSGGHKAVRMLRDVWSQMTPAQQQDALQIEADFLAKAQELAHSVAEAGHE